jgi:hypothetical protein
MKSSARGDDLPGLPRLRVSPDGYVRLSVAAFHATNLTHLLSELDPDNAAPASQALGASAASILGFTEWSSCSTPALSLGWDWRLETGAGQIRYERMGEVRSNIMLLDARRRDLGTVATEVLLGVAVDGLSWEQSVADYITNRYACHLSNLTVRRS